MSEFVELGGYIVSGETLVYPDNTTMTGNGTVENPFGVKSTDLYVQNPLFTGTSGTSAYIGWNNETLLWSGTCTSGQSATLNENIGNFKQINVYAYSHNGSPYRGIIQFDTDGDNQIYGACNATWQENIEYSILMATCSGNKVKAMGSVIIYNGSNIGSEETIYKVVGINRKV